MSTFFCLFAGMSELSLIVAISKNNAIGRNSKLLWRLRDDMAIFVKYTTGNSVIMGRKTFETLKGPLPKRQNIILTRQYNYEVEGTEIAHSIEEAVELASSEEAFVMGGGQIYKEALPYCKRLYITHVDDVVDDADTFFPEIDMSEWNCVHEQFQDVDERNEKSFRFCIYERKE